MRTVRTLSIIAGLAITGALSAVSPAAATTTATLVDVRYARHAGFDRLVFEFQGGAGMSWSRQYGTLTSPGSGERIPVEGEATLVVRIDDARAHDGNYEPTYRLRTLDPRLPALRQVKWGGDYEGTLTVGLGLMDRVAIKDYALFSPQRLVFDITHPKPFGTATVSTSGTASNVTGSGIRAGKHYHYDRAVFDVKGTAKPAVTVRYSGDTSLLLVKLSGPGTAHFTGTSPISPNLPGVKRVRLAYLSGGTMIFRIATAYRHGFRVQVLTSPVRVVVDVRH